MGNLQPLADNVLQPLADNVPQPSADTSAEKCIAAATAQVVADERLLKGRVPQVQDWLSAWAESTEQSSFRKQGRLTGKRAERARKNVRRLRRKQVRLIADNRRMHVRKILKRA